MKQKKNNQIVTWPTATLFTIKELHRLNPKFVEITLRVRLMKAIEASQVVEIGSIHGDSGRPQKVFSMTPVTQIMFDQATKEGINLVDNYKSLIGMVSTTSQSYTVSTPVPV